MVSNCSVPRCRTRYDSRLKSENGTKLSVFRFPKDETRRHQWKIAVPRKNWNPTDNMGICELHFREEDFKIERTDHNPYRNRIKPLKLKLLKDEAVPTIFQDNCQKQESISDFKSPSSEYHKYDSSEVICSENTKPSVNLEYIVLDTDDTTSKSDQYVPTQDQVASTSYKICRKRKQIEELESDSKAYNIDFIRPFCVDECLRSIRDIELEFELDLCKICGEMLNQMNSNIHYQSKHSHGSINVIKFDKSEHVCEVCSHYFISETDAKQHFRNIHASSYQCEFCHLKYPNRYLLGLHLRKMHKKRDKYVSTGKIYLSKFIKSNLLNAKSHLDGFKVIEQNKKGPSILRSSQMKIETGNLSYNSEKNKIETENLLYNSEKNIGGSEIISKLYFGCFICHEKFSIDEHLKHHLQAAHHLHSSRFPCKICGIKEHCTSMKQHLIIFHKETFDPIYYYMCKSCDLHFISIVHWKHHLLVWHGFDNSFLQDTVLLTLQNKVLLSVERQLMAFQCQKCAPTEESYILDIQDLEKHLYNSHSLQIVGKRTMCLICKVQVLPEYIYSHRVIAHGEADELTLTYFCERCDMGFTNKSNLMLHVQNFHGLKHFLTCHTCRIGFKQDEKHMLESHMLRAHYGDASKGVENKSYKCNECAKSFKFFANLQKHYKCFHQGTPSHYKKIYCNLCLFSCDKFQVYTLHYNNMHTISRKCKVCNLKCDIIPLHNHLLQDHREDFSLPKTFSCSFCDKAFKRKFNLAMHFQKFHSDKFLESSIIVNLKESEIPPVKDTGSSAHMKVTSLDCEIDKHCVVCKLSIKKSDYLDHFTSHCETNTDGHLCCFLCLKQFNQNVDLRQHLTNFHKLCSSKNSKLQLLSYPCKICGCIKEATKMEQHLIKEHTEPSKPNYYYSCTYCDFDFISETHFKLHLFAWHGIKDKLLEHIKILIVLSAKHFIIFQCKVCKCNEYILDIQDLQTHLNFKHKVQPASKQQSLCLICKVRVHDEYYKHHLKMVHDEVSELKPNKRCGIVYFKKGPLTLRSKKAKVQTKSILSNIGINQSGSSIQPLQVEKDLSDSRIIVKEEWNEKDDNADADENTINKDLKHYNIGFISKNKGTDLQNKDNSITDNIAEKVITSNNDFVGELCYQEQSLEFSLETYTDTKIEVKEEFTYDDVESLLK